MGGLLLALSLSYLLGSIPTGVIIGKLFFGKDPRQGGSGATGATNIFRQFGPAAGIAVSLVDVGKGTLAAVWASGFGSSAGLPAETVRLLAASAAVAGHVFPAFAGFKGGKGVATAAGALLGIAPWATLCSAIAFGAMLGTTGIVSASSIAAAVVFPLAIALGAQGRPPSPWLLGFGTALAVFILFTHRANIRRILRSEEKSFPKLRVFIRKKRN